MSKKKSSKNVLNYDPLAWLDETDDAENTDAASTQGTDTDINNDTEDSAAFGFFDDPADQVAIATETDSPDSEGDGGYGFFDEETVNSGLDTTIEENADDTGYGFFDDQENGDTETDASMQSETDPGFGFFEDESTAEAIANVSDNVINLGHELTIKTIDNMRQTLIARLSQGNDIALDASGLQKIDSAGVQLLLSLNNTLHKRGEGIEWVASNEIIRQATDLLGLEPITESEAAGFGFF